MPEVAKTEASVLVAPNPGCAMQIASGARERGLALDVCHVVDLLDRAVPDRRREGVTASPSPPAPPSARTSPRRLPVRGRGGGDWPAPLSRGREGVGGEGVQRSVDILGRAHRRRHLR